MGGKTATNPPIGRFHRNVLILASGTVASQVAAVVALPLLTRLYTPEHFGGYGQFTALLSILLVGAALKFDAAIPMAKSEREAFRLVVISLCVILAIFAIQVLVGLTVGSRLWTALGFLWPQSLPWAVPLAFLFASALQVLRAEARWAEDFRAVALSRVGQQLTNHFLLSIPLAFFTPNGLGLLLGHMISPVAGLATLKTRLRLHIGRLDGLGREMALAARTIRSHLGFPKYVLPASLLNVVGVQFPVFALTVLSTDYVGQYSLTTRVLALPVTLLGQAVGQVLYPFAAKQANKTLLARQVERVAIALFSLGLPVFGAIAATGPAMFELFFGAQWSEAGQYARILAPWFLFSLVSSPLSTLALVTHNHRFALIVSVAELLLRLLAGAFGVLILSSAVATVALFSIAGILVSTFSIMRIFKYVGADITRIARPAFLMLAVLLPLYVVVAHLSLTLTPLASVSISLLVAILAVLIRLKAIRALP